MMKRYRLKKDNNLLLLLCLCALFLGFCYVQTVHADDVYNFYFQKSNIINSAPNSSKAMPIKNSSAEKINSDYTFKPTTERLGIDSAESLKSKGSKLTALKSNSSISLQKKERKPWEIVFGLASGSELKPDSAFAVDGNIDQNYDGFLVGMRYALNKNISITADLMYLEIDPGSIYLEESGSAGIYSSWLYTQVDPIGRLPTKAFLQFLGFKYTPIQLMDQGNWYRLSGSLRLGYMHVSSQNSERLYWDRNLLPYWGLEAGYNFTESLGIVVGMRDFILDSATSSVKRRSAIEQSRHVSLGLSYRF